MKPQAFTLDQNWPNPFNACTAIRYVLPSSQPVSVKVHDVLGREVATLVQGHQEAGTHLVVWAGTDQEANRVSSGVYIYRLRAGSFGEAKTMTLLR